MKTIQFIAIILILALASRAYALFDDEEIGAIRNLAGAWKSKWTTPGYIEQAKAVLDGILARQDWKIQNIEGQAKPILDSLQAKQKAIQDAVNARQPDARIQQLYQELQNEQQRYGAQLQALSSEVAVYQQQKAWVGAIYTISQQVETCLLRVGLLECREKDGILPTQADIQEERRTLNSLLKTTGITTIAPENTEVAVNPGKPALEKLHEICSKKSEIVSKHLDRTLEMQDAQVQEAARTQDPTRHGL